MRRATILLLLTALLVVAPVVLRAYGVYLLSLWALYTAAAVGLNLTLGYAGQVSLGQAAFLGIGAYTVAILGRAGVGFWVALPVAALLCFAIGVALGSPALRVRQHYLAFVTLGFNVLVDLVLRNEQWLTGGNYGISGIRRPRLLGWPTAQPVVYCYLCLAALGLVSGAVGLLLRSPWGRAFAALRENPARAESLGVDTRAYTLLAFAIGAACAGVAGAFYAPLVEYVDPIPFGLGVSFALLLMVVVGGAGRFLGPFLGAGLVTLLPEWLRVTEGAYLLIYAAFVIVLMGACPGGLLGLVAGIRARAAVP